MNQPDSIVEYETQKHSETLWYKRITQINQKTRRSFVG